MDVGRFQRDSEFAWRVAPHGEMRVPAIIYASEDLIRGMDEKVYEQVTNVAKLRGIVKASYAMPDAHWGYGFPIGGVAAFDPEEGGVISAGGVGFDVSCGVRVLKTGLSVGDIEAKKDVLADDLFRSVPAGVGSTGKISLDAKQMDEMLRGGAKWAVENDYGYTKDLERIEEHGCMKGARPEFVSYHAKRRQSDEVGTLGSGNHYLEVQKVAEIFHPEAAKVFGISVGDVVISIHCGSRGLGHQIGTEFLKKMVVSAESFGIKLPDRELACAPIRSPLGEEYLGAMRAAINCALANRQVITHLVRRSFKYRFPNVELELIYDVSHNTCKEEEHEVDGKTRKLFVHRKGATRAFGPGNLTLPKIFHEIGQPVLIGGSMGTCSYILVGTREGEKLSFSSSCHGAGRSMSRTQALKRWNGKELISYLATKGILIRSPSKRGVAEEAPGAYKDVTAVVDAAEGAKISRKVAKLVPMICVKG